MKTSDIITVFNKNQVCIPSSKILQAIGKAVYSREGISHKRKINCIICSDYSIRKLNFTYRDIDKITDVLSFTFDDDDFLGEIYISAPRTAVQARRYDVSFNEEFVRLFIHGLLHLVGYDHHRENERDTMEKLECDYRDKFIPALQEKLFTCS